MNNNRPTWQLIDPDALPTPQPMLVTNNMAARTRFDHMSHVWLVPMVHRQPDGEVTAFGCNDSRIRGLTHWCPIPQPDASNA